VGEPQHAFGVQGDPVGAPDLSLAPGAQEVAVTVEDDDGMLAAREAEDVVLRVHGDAGDLDVSPPRGQLPPADDRFESHATGTPRWPSPYGRSAGGGARAPRDG